MCAGIMAIFCGVKVGDAAALSSVSGLVGAVLGYVLVGDNLTWVHLVAALISMIGVALLVSPPFLGGAPAQETSGMLVLGFTLALTAGCLHAYQAVVARKLRDVDAEFQAMIAILFTGVIILPVKFLLFPEMHGIGVILATRPWVLAASQMGVAALLYLSSVMGAFGFSRLPVSFSTTVHLATRMITGYLADVLLFSSTCTVPELVGGCLLLGSSTALAAVSKKQGSPSCPVTAREEGTKPPEQASKEV
jgi:drug/metabolite transporter (DMT)-like permease